MGNKLSDLAKKTMISQNELDDGVLLCKTLLLTRVPFSCRSFAYAFSVTTNKLECYNYSSILREKKRCMFLKWALEFSLAQESKQAKLGGFE